MSVYELQEELQKDFKFPYYYEKNWDAFYDAMNDKLVDGKVSVVFSGMDSFYKRFPQDANALIRSLKDLNQDHPRRLDVTIRK